MSSYSDLGLATNKSERSARTQRDATLAQNAYSRFLSQQRGSRQLADLQQRADRDLGALSAAYSQRGLRNSGLQQQGRNQFAQDTFRQQQAVVDQTAQQIDLSNLSDQQAQAAYEAVVQEAELAKSQGIAQLAAQLLEYYPFLGS